MLTFSALRPTLGSCENLHLFPDCQSSCSKTSPTLSTVTSLEVDTKNSFGVWRCQLQDALLSLPVPKGTFWTWAVAKSWASIFFLAASASFCFFLASASFCFAIWWSVSCPGWLKSMTHLLLVLSGLGLLLLDLLNILLDLRRLVLVLHTEGLPVSSGTVHRARISSRILPCRRRPSSWEAC